MDNHVLNNLHRVEIEILDEINRICKKHNINYFLDSGTALGAIRHKGFIPWDDDVDIGMLRNDYEAFISIARAELDEKFFLQDKESEPLYSKYNAKVRKRHTVFPEDASAEYSERGIFIDIYPFDFCGNSYKEAIRSVKKGRMKLRILRFRQTGECRKGIKRFIFQFFKLLPEVALESDYKRYCVKNENGKFLTCYSYRMLQTKDLVFPSKIFEEYRRIEFEDREYSIMSGWDTYLKIMYGDYMKLPEENERVCHLSGDIKFED